MRIAIVDDNVEFLAQTARTLQLLLDERGVVSAEVGCFASADELLVDWEKGLSYDLYFLDVIMPGQDGIALGRRIRARQREAPIFFFTTSRDFAVEAFALEATGYVLKPFSQDAFAQAVDRALRALPKSRLGHLVFKSDTGIVRLAFADVAFSETVGHFQIVNAIDARSFVTRLVLQDLWDKLKDDGRFVRVGRRLIVNLEHVVNLDGMRLVLAGGHSLAVPRRLWAEVKAYFMRFYGA